MQQVGRVVAELDLGLLRAERAVALAEMGLVEKRQVLLALLADVAAIDEAEQAFGFDAVLMLVRFNRRRLVDRALCARVCVIVVGVCVAFMTAAVAALGQRRRRKCC
jgi:hypothetical protein